MRSAGPGTRSTPSSSTCGSLRPVLALEDEQGIEVFYTWQLGWLRLTANAQFVDSGIEAADSTTFVGVRAKVGL